LECI